jgi:hypothetical protein
MAGYGQIWLDFGQIGLDIDGFWPFWQRSDQIWPDFGHFGLIRPDFSNFG